MVGTAVGGTAVVGTAVVGTAVGGFAVGGSAVGVGKELSHLHCQGDRELEQDRDRIIIRLWNKEYTLLR